MERAGDCWSFQHDAHALLNSKWTSQYVDVKLFELENQATQHEDQAQGHAHYRCFSVCTSPGNET